MNNNMRHFGIGLKIFSGFLILATMLIISGILSVFEIYNIGSSVELMLEDNYKSINATEEMVEALEREDSGILLLLMGRWEEGRKILSSADSAFSRNLTIASNNITIPGEHEYVNRVRATYNEYKSIWEKPIVGTMKEENLNWYTEVVHKSFLRTKQETEQLMRLNDEVLYQTASDLKDRTHRSIMPGIVSVVSAIIFVLIFYYFVTYYFVKPIVRITNAIISFIDDKKPYRVTVETKDEIYLLNDSVTQLCSSQKK
jgi:methyl-accepting chemotaxis protein